MKRRHQSKHRQQLHEICVPEAVLTGDPLCSCLPNILGQIRSISPVSLAQTAVCCTSLIDGLKILTVMHLWLHMNPQDSEPMFRLFLSCISSRIEV